jgi:predicted nuclease of predicted toxin-antitoxin system
MDILADENVRRDMVDALRRAGHDVLWIAEIRPRAPDSEVFAIAVSEQRFLLTSDRDFNEIVYRQRRQGLRGLILVRVRIRQRPAYVKAVLDVWHLVTTSATWEGKTTIIQPGRFRQRPLP